NYVLTLAFLERNQVADLKIYPLSIKSNNIFGPTSFLNPYEVKAQALQNGPEYAQWITMMESLGVYPHLDPQSGQIFYYNRDQFVANFCSNGTPCLLPQATTQEVLDSAKGDQEFIVDLEQMLLQNKYAPFECLLPYFPEIADTDAYKQYIQQGSKYAVSPLLQPDKFQIDDQSLTNFIKQESQIRGLTEKDPIQILINVSDPIF